MTVFCVICKKRPISYDRTRSFHRFPANENAKKAWMSVIGVSSITKLSTVCSDHFDQSSYHQTDGYTHLRRLLADAIPSLNGFKKNEFDSNQAIIVPKTEPPEDNSLATENTTDSYKDSNAMIHLNSEENFYGSQFAFNAVNKQSSISSIPSSSVENIKLSPIILEQKASDSEASFIQEQSSSSSNEKEILNYTTNIKRKHPMLTAGNPTKKMKIRFMDGFQTKYISRHDFVSDQAWDNFLRFCAIKNYQKENYRLKNLRSKRKIEHLKELNAKMKNVAKEDF
ncbi:uncharacterized protein LOC130903478 [Diorhabda carinulata]|uniref:uncharacterized protein LOC130903478 n=1 Tax=Diorhabda carinulata TaxID=1163345 RepID=UPI0025A18916|nr:uncharacterized protein LOC130903478 [Diorhabda carinulata]